MWRWEAYLVQLIVNHNQNQYFWYSFLESIWNNDFISLSSSLKSVGKYCAIQSTLLRYVNWMKINNYMYNIENSFNNRIHFRILSRAQSTIHLFLFSKVMAMELKHGEIYKKKELYLTKFFVFHVNWDDFSCSIQHW